MEEKTPKPFCKLCAGFSDERKYKHTMDPKTCRPGRKQWYKTLSAEDQLVQFRMYEILSPKIADHIEGLSKDRGLQPWEIMESEGLWLL